MVRNTPAEAVAGGGPGRRGRRRSRHVAGVAVIAVAGMLAAACGGGTSDSTGGSSSDGSAAGTPKTGGTLTFAEFSAPVGLDPIVMTGAGVTGLIETTAIYDTLMRYNYDTGAYEPGTAESATPNDDATVWTLKIRPGVTFTDGTPYDADAVVFGINRFRSGQEGAPACADIVACPRNSSSSGFMASFIKDVTATDASTVTITLKQPWASFPVALSSEVGLIPSPTALKKCDASAPASQCSFNTAPVGAGPFMITSFKPGEAITMTRNPDYWGGPANLDGLRFINLGDAGGQKTLDALTSGAAQVAFVRDPAAVADAHAAGLDGWSSPQYGGSVLLLNMADPNAGTASLKVRQAVAAAVDPQVVNQRAYQGKAQASSQVLPPSFRWYPDVPGPKYDVAEAKRLVNEAKAEGWDGKIRVLAANAPVTSNIGLAVQAMLQSVGMDVALDNSKDTAATIGLLTKRDFDVYVGGMPAGNDDTGAIGLAQNFLSTSPSNRVGVKDPAIDAAFADVFAATTDAEKKAAYGEVATAINKVTPAALIAPIEEFVAWTGKVHGIQPDVKTGLHLEKAWLD